MKNFRSFLLCFVIFMNSFCVVAIFDVKRLRVVDYDKKVNNYLFRGNYPGGRDRKSYDYDILTHSMKDLAKSLNLTAFPEDYVLICITLIQPNTDEFNVEVAFWKDHKDLGGFIHYPLLGMFLNASTLPEDNRNKLVDFFETWDNDRLYERVPAVNEMLKMKYKKPHVFYIHCSSGVDRTGEFSGSYKMQFQGYDFPTASKWDIEIDSGRNIEYHVAVEFNWYCFYLDRILKIPDLDCLNWSPWK